MNLFASHTQPKGLVNGYKISLVKNGAVLWESFRTGSVPAIGIKDLDDRREASIKNATELLEAVAANHCRKFSREELQTLQLQGEALNIPFTSVCLLTPFFLTDREDQQLLEHAHYLRQVLSLVKSVTLDLMDNKPPITVKVEYTEPVLLNFGTNIVMKTFMIGLGVQRAINVRNMGMRAFERKVATHLMCLLQYKNQLRVQFFTAIDAALLRNSGRSGKMYMQIIQHRRSQLDNSFALILESKKQNESFVKQMEQEMKYKQYDLEAQILEWLPKLNDVALAELFYLQNVAPLVNNIDQMHDKIFSIEMNKDVLGWYDTIVEVEPLVVTDMETLMQTWNVNKPAQWQEYLSLIQRFHDVWTLFKDITTLYHSKYHERFVQGLVETSELQKVDPYSLPVRVLMLSFLLGEETHFNCKSGKDRTGQCADQCMVFAEVRAQYGKYIVSQNEKNEFNDHCRAIHTAIALNASSLEIIKENLGIPGSKMDKVASARFIKGFYERYKGLASFDTATFASSDEEWNQIVRSVYSS